MKTWLTNIVKRINKILCYVIVGMTVAILICWIILGVFSPILLGMLIVKW